LEHTVDDESGKSTEEDEVTGIGKDEVRIERLIRGCGQKPVVDSRDKLGHMEMNCHLLVTRMM